MNTLFEIKDLLNKNKKDAIDLIKLNNFKYRVIKEDNNTFVVTRDYCVDRINLTIKNNIVIEAKLG